jgi:hypothetical protein
VRKAAGADAVVPDFGTNRKEGESDFNDLAARFRLGLVSRQIFPD